MERYVHLECGRCGERLYTDLVDFVQAEGSQPHLDAEIYTNQEPDSLAHLCDKEVHGCRGISFNCSQDCHPMQFLIDTRLHKPDFCTFWFSLFGHGPSRLYLLFSGPLVWWLLGTILHCCLLWFSG